MPQPRRLPGCEGEPTVDKRFTVVMAASVQVEFLKVLACVAWADGEVTNAELNFIKRFVRQFDLSGDEWAQVEMYLEEKVDLEEMKRVTRRFLSGVARRKERGMLLGAAQEILETGKNLTESEREWIRSLQELMADTRRNAFLLDGLKSLLRVGAMGQAPLDDAREMEFHDFIHNRVLFKLRRRLGTKRLEKEGSPDELKKLTLSATLMGQVGYVDEKFLPEEEACVKTILCEVWGASRDTADAVAHLTMETVSRGVDLYRVIQEVKATMRRPERRRLVEGMFALAKAEGNMSHEEIEAIRKVAYGLELSQKEFIDAKLKILHA